ncbi:putative formaldehyde dehydrogenase, glutathione-independent [Mycobacterium xenopi 4042]|uniref:Putative formaldehyde dehydrogenase, glutathione-independent n=1 Tax=Mycobacterium xenopi 4042 TaxID=1299334 RepID=X7YQY1_MYCXE|nr:putative formaldehyde dehydrogenase, glutathione-independent [Mycobacterium xenopi 4042]
MRQLVFEEDGRYAWRETVEPEIKSPEQALVRPTAVACCDLDVAVVEGRLPMPPGHAVGHEGWVRSSRLATMSTPSGRATGWWCRFRSAAAVAHIAAAA